MTSCQGLGVTQVVHQGYTGVTVVLPLCYFTSGITAVFLVFIRLLQWYYTITRGYMCVKIDGVSPVDNRPSKD